jgi:hypothetical protein
VDPGAGAGSGGIVPYLPLPELQQRQQTNQAGRPAASTAGSMMPPATATQGAAQ